MATKPEKAGKIVGFDKAHGQDFETWVQGRVTENGELHVERVFTLRQAPLPDPPQD